MKFTDSIKVSRMHCWVLLKKDGVAELADLTVLSKDIMKIPEPEILTTTCAMTVVGGEIVYEAQP